MAPHRNIKEHLGEPPSSPEALHPGAKILYVCDSTDGLEDSGIINGVKRTQLSLTKALDQLGYTVDVLHPQKQGSNNQPLFWTAQLPGYEGFQFAVNPLPTLPYLKKTQPDGVFIATPEGPLGMATAFACYNPLFLGKTEVTPYTASFTTRLDKTIGDMVKQWATELGKKSPAWAKPLLDAIALDPRIFHPWQRALYNGANKILVPTTTMMHELDDIGLPVQDKGVLWPRGIDTETFHLPNEDEAHAYEQYEWQRENPKKIALYFGRVAPEKNIDAFLSADMSDFHQVIIGDGPYRAELEERYPQAHFLGKQYGEELARLVRWADVHIFPSLTDTFGNTILEAGASGVSTVGFTGVPGPQDIIHPGVSGYLIEQAQELPQAAARAAHLKKDACAHDIISRYSWKTAAEALVQSLQPTPYQKQAPPSLR